jgi:hypothetical protein
MLLYTYFLHNLLNVRVEIANKMGLQKKKRKLFAVYEIKMKNYVVVKIVTEFGSLVHCLDDRLTDGGAVVSLTHYRALLSRNIIFLLLVLISVRA